MGGGGGDILKNFVLALGMSPMLLSLSLSKQAIRTVRADTLFIFSSLWRKTLKWAKGAAYQETVCPTMSACYKAGPSSNLVSAP